MYPVPGFVRKLAGTICGVLLLSAAAGVIASLVANERPALALFGFEIVTAVASVLGLLFARGRYTDAPGLALASVGGTVFVASVLGFIGVGPEGELGGVGMRPFLLARVAAAAGIGLLGAHCVLMRHPKGWPTAIRAALLGLPVLAAGVGALTLYRRERLWTLLDGYPVVLQLAIVILAFIVLGTLTCISIHLAIRAFEYGRTGPDRPA